MSFKQTTDAINDIPHIVTVCRLVEKKGVDTLIRAFAKLTAKAKLVIAGEGPQRAELEQIARDVHVADRIEFMGAVANDRIRELLQTSNFFVLPCRIDRNGDKDGIPVVLMEAMACGLPVISGNLPAIRELVIDGETGLLVDGTDVDSTSEALASLIHDSVRARTLAEKARAHVAREFSLATNIDRLETALRSAIQKGSAERTRLARAVSAYRA